MYANFINIFTENDSKTNRRFVKIAFKKISFLVLFSYCNLVFTQTLGSNLDKKTLALGEVGTFKILISDLQGKDVVSAPKNELLPFHFEEIKDSISKTSDVYERVIQFQIFEEGKFKIPTFDFKIGDERFHTVPYEIQVVNTAQKSDQINDIMNNKEVKLNMKDYWELYKWYLIGFLIFVAVIFVIYHLVRYAKRRKNSPVVMTNKTLKALDQLKKKKYIENGNSRLFYVELIDITRDFLTQQYHIPADVLLSDDLIALMKNNNTISIENERTVEDVLLRGDLVKFAKTLSDRLTMEKDWTEICEFVKRSSKDLEFEKLVRKDV